MRKTSQLALMFLSVLSVLTLAVAPVGAEQGSGSDSSGSGDSSQTTSTDSTSGGTSTTTSTDTEKSSDKTAETKTEVNELEGKARTLLENERKDGTKHSEAERKTACQAHAAEINKRFGNYVAAAQRHQSVFDSIFTKVQDFYTSKKLNVTNYATLLAATQAKQAASQQAIAALQALNVEVDCTQTDPAQTVATMKTAVANARDALQAYRAAIKDLIVAIKGASTAQTDQSTTGGNQ